MTTFKISDISIYNTGKSAGLHEVSLYEETNSEETGSSTGLPNMNVTYEFSETAKNDIEEIIQACYENVKSIGDEDTINGHSPMDRLVVAVALYLDVDPIKALSQGNYPNQLKRIAAIIRGDFNEHGDDSDS